MAGFLLGFGQIDDVTEDSARRLTQHVKHPERAGNGGPPCGARYHGANVIEAHFAQMRRSRT
jgi:hypothetical protein